MTEQSIPEALLRRAERLADEALESGGPARWIMATAHRRDGTGRRFWIAPGSKATQQAAAKKGRPPVAHHVALDGSGCTCEYARRSRSGLCVHRVAAEVIRQRRRALQQADLARRQTGELDELEAAAYAVAAGMLGGTDARK